VRQDVSISAFATVTRAAAWLLLSIVAPCFVDLSSPALATCGAANCFLVTGTREGINDQGAITFDLSYRYVDQSRKLDGSSPADEVLTPKVDFENGVLLPDHHREIRTQNTLMQLDLDYGLTGRVTLFGVLPFLNERRHEHFDDAGTPGETFVNTDGTSGFGDVRFGGRGALIVRPKDILVGGLAVKIPTGAYRLRDSEGAINEPTIQPGTGAVGLAGSLFWGHHPFPSRFEWFSSGTWHVNPSNDLHYRIGNEVLLSAGANRKMKRAVWSIQVNGRWTRRDVFLGERVPSTGAATVLLTPGVRLSVSDATSFYAYAQAPLYERVNEAQIAPRGGVVFGVAKTFR